MDDREKEMLATYRAEATALFAANQAGRTAAERALALLFTLVAVAVAAGIHADTPAVILPLPSVALLLFAHMCNQYSDLTVIGMARRHIEDRVNDLLGTDTLLYETAVAPIRKEPPLEAGARVLQALVGVILVAVVVAGAVVAFDDQPAWASVVFCVGTALSLGAAVTAYATMLKTPEVATKAIDAKLSARAAQRHAG